MIFRECNFLYQATAELKQAFKDPAIIPALCAVMTGSQNPQVDLLLFIWVFMSSFHSPTQRLVFILASGPSVCCSDAQDESQKTLEENQSRPQRKVLDIFFTYCHPFWCTFANLWFKCFHPAPSVWRQWCCRLYSKKQSKSGGAMVQWMM